MIRIIKGLSALSLALATAGTILCQKELYEAEIESHVLDPVSARQIRIAPLQNENNFEEAILYYTRLIQYSRDELTVSRRGEIENRLGEMYHVLREESKSLFWYTKAAKDGNSSAQDSLGIHYREIGDFKNAFYYFKLAVDKSYKPAQFHLAELYEKVGNMKEALKYHKLAAGTSGPYSLINLASFYQRQNDLKKAEHYFKLHSHQSNDPEDLEILADFYFTTKQYNKAADLYRRVGQLYESNNELYLAERSYRRALEADKDDTRTSQLLEEVQLKLQVMRQDALKEAEYDLKLRSQQSNDPMDLEILADFYFATKQYNKAADLYQRVGQLYESNNELYLAERSYKSALEADKDDSRIRQLLQEVQLKLARLKDEL